MTKTCSTCRHMLTWPDDPIAMCGRACCDVTPDETHDCQWWEKRDD